METLEIRAAALEKYLRLIAGDKTIDLVNLPQIVSLRPIKYRSWLNVFGAGTEQKKVENIPVPILVDAFIDVMDLDDKRNRKAEELRKTINKMPESDSKRAMLLWFRQGITNIDDLRAKLTLYFTGLLDQAGATANAMSRSFVITLSIILVLLLGTDSISLARDFWYLPQIRAALSAQASVMVQSSNVTDMGTLISELDNLSLSIGWPQLFRYLPADATLLQWIQFIVLRILGLGITAIFVSQGSGFWFDVLRKLK